MKVPAWNDVVHTHAKDRTALENFVYHNEPAGEAEEKRFRAELQALLDEVAPETKPTEPKT